MLYRLADRLHKTVFEIEQMTFEELAGWAGYFEILQREKQ